MLYMVRPGVAERMEQFTRSGGTLVLTYWSGMTNENDLCFLGGFPGPLRKLAGVWSEEIDSLYDTDSNGVVMKEGNPLRISGQFSTFDFCDLIHAETADVLAVYADDFYRGRPALTANRYGNGCVYYIAARTGNDFLDAFYGSLAEKLSLARAIDAVLPEGVTAQLRTDGKTNFVFLMNFTEEAKIVKTGREYRDLLSGETQGCEIVLPQYGVKLLEIPR